MAEKIVHKVEETQQRKGALTGRWGGRVTDTEIRSHVTVCGSVAPCTSRRAQGHVQGPDGHENPRTETN